MHIIEYLCEWYAFGGGVKIRLLAKVSYANIYADFYLCIFCEMEFYVRERVLSSVILLTNVCTFADYVLTLPKTYTTNFIMALSNFEKEMEKYERRKQPQRAVGKYIKNKRTSSVR